MTQRETPQVIGVRQAMKVKTNVKAGIIAVLIG